MVPPEMARGGVGIRIAIDQMAVGDKRLAESDMTPEIGVGVAIGVGDQNRKQNDRGRITQRANAREPGRGGAPSEPRSAAPASAKAAAAETPVSATMLCGIARPSPLVSITRRAA